MSTTTIPAYAVAEHGRLLVDTVRATEADAKCAAIKLVKQPGTGWRELERDRGYRVVRIQVLVEASRVEKRPRL
jgi:hypothetical protein